MVKATIDDPFVDDDPSVDTEHATSSADLAAELQRAFGHNLRQARIAEGLTHDDVEERTGLPQGCLNNIEAGQVDPSIGLMATLAMVVGRDLWTLLAPLT